MDWFFLLWTFIISLFASILSNIVIIKVKEQSGSAINKRNLRKQSKPHDNKKHSMSSNIKVSNVSVTPIKNKYQIYWMDDKWTDEYPIYADAHTMMFHKLTENELLLMKITENKGYSKLLMELIPSLSKDVIRIIVTFARIMDQCMSKYALLDCTNESNEYINFYVDNIEFMNAIKTIKRMQINSSTSSAKEILNKIPKLDIIECMIYFRDNYNAMIEGQYFVLRSLSKLHNSLSTHILCQFGSNNDVYLIKEISFNWKKHVMSPTSLSSLMEVKFDGRYIYAAKDDVFRINMYDEKQNIVQPMTYLIYELECHTHKIEYYQLYDQYMISSLPESDGYLMISRRYYTKLELYQIDDDKDQFLFEDNIKLYCEFEVKHIFNKINTEYHRRFNVDGSINDVLPTWDTILAFQMDDDNILFCVYYNAFLDRLFAVNIKLSLFEDAKLINYTLLDGRVGGAAISQTFNLYSKCSGIEAIYTNEGKEWLIFCDRKNEFGLIWHETEFSVKANTLTVKYGKRTKKQFHRRYLESLHRKQMS